VIMDLKKKVVACMFAILAAEQGDNCGH